jgi:hypothetical protein
MKNLRVVDQAGNKQDYETEFVPRIGERILLEYGSSRETVKPHYFRVKDVMYQLQERADIQPAILIQEEDDPEFWPG